MMNVASSYKKDGSGTGTAKNMLGVLWCVLYLPSSESDAGVEENLTVAPRQVKHTADYLEHCSVPQYFF